MNITKDRLNKQLLEKIRNLKSLESKVKQKIHSSEQAKELFKQYNRKTRLLLFVLPLIMSLVGVSLFFGSGLIAASLGMGYCICSIITGIILGIIGFYNLHAYFDYRHIRIIDLEEASLIDEVNQLELEIDNVQKKHALFRTQLVNSHHLTRPMALQYFAHSKSNFQNF